MSVRDIGEGAVIVIVAVLIFMPAGGALSTWFLWKLWNSDRRRPRSWVLRTMIISSVTINLLSIPIGVLAARRLAGFEPLDPLFIALVYGAIIVALESVPIYFALRVYAQMHVSAGRYEKRANLASDLPESALLSADEQEVTSSIKYGREANGREERQ